jgi:hypothetical protein
LDVFNKHLTEEIDGCDILSEASLCQTPTESCMDRACAACGTHQVQTKINAALKNPVETKVSWKLWDNVKTDDGKTKKDLVVKEGSLGNLTARLLSELHPFARHLDNFRCRPRRLKQHFQKNDGVVTSKQPMNDS